MKKFRKFMDKGRFRKKKYMAKGEPYKEKEKKKRHWQPLGVTAKIQAQIII